MAAQAVAVYGGYMIKSLSIAALLAVTVLAAPACAQSRPDTEFCAAIRKKDPGGICTPSGDYVTPEKVYKPDGTVINRNAGN